MASCVVIEISKDRLAVRVTVAQPPGPLLERGGGIAAAVLRRPVEADVDERTD